MLTSFSLCAPQLKEKKYGYSNQGFRLVRDISLFSCSSFLNNFATGLVLHAMKTENQTLMWPSLVQVTCITAFLLVHWHFPRLASATCICFEFSLVRWYFPRSVPVTPSYMYLCEFTGKGVWSCVCLWQALPHTDVMSIKNLFLSCSMSIIPPFFFCFSNRDVIFFWSFLISSLGL